jgi:hypothetical protein
LKEKQEGKLQSTYREGKQQNMKEKQEAKQQST